MGFDNWFNVNSPLRALIKLEIQSELNTQITTLPLINFGRLKHSTMSYIFMSRFANVFPLHVSELK